jgi:hypothetical protein
MESNNFIHSSNFSFKEMPWSETGISRLSFNKDLENLYLTFRDRSTNICELEGKVELTKVHMFVHWKVRLK